VTSAEHLRVALAQVTYDDEEREGSVADRARGVAADLAARLAGEEVDLVVLPELWAVGAFRPRTWAERAESLDGPTSAAMADLARDTGALVHLGSILERDTDGALHNTSIVLTPSGERLATYRKIHRFAAGGLEGELLTGGEEVVVADLPTRTGATVRAGLSICYDMRFPELYRAQVAAGAELMVIPASWPRRRIGVWDLLLRARAVENQCAVVGVNAVGVDGRTPMGGRSAVIDAWGEAVSTPMGGGEDEGEGAAAPTQVAVVDFDLAAVRDARESFPVLPDRRMSVVATPLPERRPGPS